MHLRDCTDDGNDGGKVFRCGSVLHTIDVCEESAMTIRRVQIRDWRGKERPMRELAGRPKANKQFTLSPQVSKRPQFA